MARVPLIDPDTVEDQAIVAAVRARRRGRISNLDRVMLNSPSLAAGWNAIGGAVRDKTSLPADILELAICYVALINRAEYEYEHHLPLWVAAGASPTKIEGLKRLATGDRAGPEFTAAEQAVATLTWQMTREIAVEEAVFVDLRAHFDSRQIVDLVGAVGFYNLVSRFLVALAVDAE